MTAHRSTTARRPRARATATCVSAGLLVIAVALGAPVQAQSPAPTPPEGSSFCRTARNAVEQPPSPEAIPSARYQLLRVARAGPVLVATIANPPRNELATKLLRDLTTLFQAEAAADDVRAVVLTGERGFFSGGAGRGNYSGPNTRSNPSPDIAVDLYDRIETFPKPVIIAVNGVSQGGGNELATASDFRIASTEASFVQPEILNETVPGFGGMQRLQRVIGRAHTLDLVLTGRVLTAQQAREIGLVSDVVAPDQLLPCAIGLGVMFSRQVPEAIAQAKLRVARGPAEPPSEAIRRDVEAFRALVEERERRAAARGAAGQQTRD